MELTHFHKMRTAVQDNAHPGDRVSLDDMRNELQHKLMESGLFEEVEVDLTDDPDQLVIALCQFKPFLDESDVARSLERLWTDEVRYPYWSAHAVVTFPEHVEFEAATRASSGGHYATVHLVAQRARIPAQRVPSEQ